MNRVFPPIFVLALVFTTGCPPKNPEPAANENYTPLESAEKNGQGSEMLTDANTNPSMESTATPPRSTRTYNPPADEPVAPAAGGKTYTVQKGDNLHSIARKMYGKDSRWRDILGANRARIKDQNKLTVGQKLIIP